MDYKTASEILKNYLKEKKLRSTPERNKILAKIIKMDNHFDAEELYKHFCKENGKIALATIYNTLDLLVHCGIITKYRFGEDHFHYDKSIDKPRHHHLICLKCGDIIEIFSDDISEIESKIAKQKSFKIQNSTLQIFGTCKNCQLAK